MNYMDAEAMKTLMKMNGDMFAITNEEPSDPSKFIMIAVRPINNWTWVRFSKTWGKSFVMQVPMYFSIFSLRYILIWLTLMCPITLKLCT